MEYKYETHCHTKETSGCATATAEEQVELYKKMGYSGLITTDHFFNGNCRVDRTLSWEEKIDCYCLGYEHAKQAGDKLGMTVMFGIEYTFLGTDLLLYGLTKKWLKENPQIMDMKVPQLIKLIHNAGGMVIHAHPFREVDYIDTIRLYPRDVDGVEVYNAGNMSEEMNVRADWYADSYGLPKTSGSDRHHNWFETFGGICTERKIENIGDYINAVKSGGVTRLIKGDKLK